MGLTNKELQEKLSKYPDDLKIVIGVESQQNGIGIFYNTVCGGIDAGSERMIYISSEGLGLEFDCLYETLKENGVDIE